MKKIAILMLTALAITSCGTFKKTSDIQKSDSTTTIQGKVIADTKTDTKEKIVTKEKADTNVTVPADSMKATGSLAALIAGDTVKAEANGSSILIYRDGNNVIAKATTAPKTIPVQFEREIIQTTDKAETSHVKAESNLEHSVTSEQEHVTKEDTGYPWYVYVMFFVACIIVIVLIMLGLRYL